MNASAEEYISQYEIISQIYQLLQPVFMRDNTITDFVKIIERPHDIAIMVDRDSPINGTFKLCCDKTIQVPWQGTNKDTARYIVNKLFDMHVVPWEAFIAQCVWFEKDERHPVDTVMCIYGILCG